MLTQTRGTHMTDLDTIAQLNTGQHVDHLRMRGSRRASARPGGAHAGVAVALGIALALVVGFVAGQEYAEHKMGAAAADVSEQFEAEMQRLMSD